MGATVDVDVYARDHASRTFDKVGSSATRSSGMLRKFGTTVAGVFTGAALYNGAERLTRALVDMTEGAAEDEAAQKRMAAAFRTNADATRAQVAATEDWITQQGVALGVADDDLRPALTKLVAVTHDVGDAQDQVSQALDISAGSGKSFSTVIDAMVKGNNGAVTGFSRMGAVTKDAAGETLSYDEILKGLSRTWGGQASKAANTAAGEYQRLKVEFSETGEAIGYKLLPLANEFGSWILDEGLPAAQDLGGELADELGPTVRDLADWFSENKDELKDFATTAGGEALDAIRTLADIGGTAVEVFEKLPGPVKEFGGELLFAAYAVPKLSSAVGKMKLTEFIGNLGKAETRATALKGAVSAAAGAAGMALLIDSTNRSSRSLGALESAAGGAAIGFSVGGPLGAALGAGAGGIAWALRDSANAADTAGDAFHFASPEAGDFADQLNKVSGAATGAARHTAALALQQSGALEAGRALGLSSQDLVKYVFGNEKAIARVNAAMSAANSETITWTDSLGQTHSVLAGNSADAIKLNTALGRNASAFEDSKQKAQELAVAGGDLGKALKGVQDRSSIVAKIDTQGYPETKGQLAALLAQYDLGRKDVKAVIKALGIDTTVADVQRVIDRINAVHDKDVTITTHHNDTYGGLAGGGGHEAAGSAGPDKIPGKPSKRYSRDDVVHRFLRGDDGRGSFLDAPISEINLTPAGAALVGTLISGIDKGRKPLAKVLDSIHDDVEAKANSLQNLLTEKANFAAGFDWRTSVFGMTGDDETGPLTVDKILAQAASEKAKAAQTDSDIATLVGMGLSEDLLRQMQSQGESGIESIHVLASASQDQINQLVSDNTEAQKSWAHAGEVTASKIYDGQILVAQANLATSQKLDTAIDELRRYSELISNVQFELHGSTLVGAIAKDQKNKGKHGGKGK